MRSLAQDPGGEPDQLIRVFGGTPTELKFPRVWR